MASGTVAGLLSAVAAACLAPPAATAGPPPASGAPCGQIRSEAAPAAFVTRGWTFRPAAQEKGGQAEKPAPKTLTFTFTDRPSLRYGDLFRLDVRLLLQGDGRRPGGIESEESGDTFTLTRRRLGIQGTFFRIVEYEIERELKPGGPWRDVFVNVRAAPFCEVQAGKFKVPFGREELDSPRDRSFVFRSLVMSEVAPQRARGAMLHGRLLGRRIRYEAGLFDGDGDNSPAIETPPYPLTDDAAAGAGRSVAGRVIAVPFGNRPGRHPLRTLEVGAALVSSTLTAGMNHFRGTTALGTRFFPRSLYVNGNRSRLGAEFAWTPGPFSLQAEYVRAEEQRLGMGVGDETRLDNDLPPLITEGWYVAATWVATGETKEGRVRPTRPLFQGGFGAIEMAARYDLLRLGAGDTSAPPTTSPRAADVAAATDRVATLGVNWYVNTWIKIQVNGIRESIQGSRREIPGPSTFWSGTFRIQFSM